MQLLRCFCHAACFYHFQKYLKLAYLYGDAADVDQVIEKVRAGEQELIESPDSEFRFHSGVPTF